MDGSVKPFRSLDCCSVFIPPILETSTLFLNLIANKNKEFKAGLFSPLQMYVELYGKASQTADTYPYPDKVYLRLRHSSASYFRDGNEKIREFHQPLLGSSPHKFEFDRVAITDTNKCSEEKRKGNSK